MNSSNHAESAASYHADLRCDYCPTVFHGPVCPGCGYDFTGVYSDLDAARALDADA